MKKAGIISLVLSMFLFLFCSCGHKHDLVKTIIKEATCTEEGIIKNYCNSCDYVYEEKIEPFGHDYDDGSVIIDSTCTTDGKKEYVCKTCNNKKDEIISAGHKFSEQIVRKATCTATGEKAKLCSVCGYKETENIKKKSHSFIDNKCVYCNAIKLDIVADSWYHNDLVNVQNCAIVDSYVKVAGDVFASYYPVCKECHVPGNLSIAYLTKDEPHLKTYHCECGGQTTIRINVY